MAYLFDLCVFATAVIEKTENKLNLCRTQQ